MPARGAGCRVRHGGEQGMLDVTRRLCVLVTRVKYTSIKTSGCRLYARSGGRSEWQEETYRKPASPARR